ncbi:MAG: hypothetical protein GY870_04955 [archaeon]|nr:hypothetical protein [archaeon]
MEAKNCNLLKIEIMKNVVTFHFLAPIAMNVSNINFPETHVISGADYYSAKKWAVENLSSYFEQGFKLKSIELEN